MPEERVRGVLWTCSVVMMVTLLLPGRGLAQSAIAGTVKDASGAVMPGVTVEASSPVLIEKTKSAVTDGSGQYRIIDLRPGVYTGHLHARGLLDRHSRRRRPPSHLHGQHRRGAESRLARGEHHRVGPDTAGRRPERARSSRCSVTSCSKSVPSGRNIWGVGATLTGVSFSAPDVGGTAGMQQTYMAVHGSDRRDNSIQVDGMIVNGIEGDGAIQNYFNQGMFEEMSYQTSALGAEVQSSGVRLNMIPQGRQQRLQGVAVLVAHAGRVAERQLHAGTRGDRACARPIASSGSSISIQASAARS